MREICQRHLYLSQGFLFGLFTTTSYTLPIELKAHSVSSSLNLLTSNHESRQVTLALLKLVLVEVAIAD